MSDCAGKSVFSTCVGYLDNGICCLELCRGCDKYYCFTHMEGHGCRTVLACKARGCWKPASCNGYCNYCSRRTPSVGYRPNP